MMNYYKIKRSDAESLGIDLFAHRVSDDFALVSDMDLRRVMGFGKSPQEMQEACGVEPLTQRQMAGILRDPQWTFHKG